MTTRLDIINSMLATTGTAKLAATDVGHPDYIQADRLLDDILEEFAARPLWFNTVIRTLEPNFDEKIVIPSNAISCDPTDDRLNYAIRGQYLFDLDNYTDIIPVPVECRIQMQVVLEDMPPIAIQFIRSYARFQYFVDKDGSKQKVELYGSLYSKSDQQLEAINLKHSGHNFFRGRGYQSFITRRQTTLGHLPIRT